MVSVSETGMWQEVKFEIAILGNVKIFRHFNHTKKDEIVAVDLFVLSTPR